MLSTLIAGGGTSEDAAILKATAVLELLSSREIGSVTRNLAADPAAGMTAPINNDGTPGAH
jgi:hypothetical protein